MAPRSRLRSGYDRCGCAFRPLRRKEPKRELRALREKIERMTQQVSRDAVQRDRLSARSAGRGISVGQARGEVDPHRPRVCRPQRPPRRAGRGQGAAATGAERGAPGAGRAIARGLPDRPRGATQAAARGEEPLRSERLFTYYGYFGRARARQIADIAQHVQRLDVLDTRTRAAAVATREPQGRAAEPARAAGAGAQRAPARTRQPANPRRARTSRA